jgi:hypothetical protein
MKVGDKFTWIPSEFSAEKSRYGNGMTIPIHVTGKVAWIHPRKRFFLVEGVCNGCLIRECFPMERR